MCFGREGSEQEWNQVPADREAIQAMLRSHGQAQLTIASLATCLIWQCFKIRLLLLRVYSVIAGVALCMLKVMHEQHSPCCCLDHNVDQVQADPTGNAKNTTRRIRPLWHQSQQVYYSLTWSRLWSPGKF